MSEIRRLGSANVTALPGLCDLLIDAVQGGASVGFLAPLTPDRALAYWRQVLGALDDDLVLWVAEEGGRVVGSVQLSLCGKENGRHRAEVQKLFVLRTHRGNGIASALVSALESFAITGGRSLLVLDTSAGSRAEAVYQHLGWEKAGEIPQFAAMPDGEVRATAYYYKQLGTRDGGRPKWATE